MLELNGSGVKSGQKFGPWHSTTQNRNLAFKPIFFVKPNFACINSTFKMAYLHSTLASAPAPAYPFGRLRAR